MVHVKEETNLSEKEKSAEQDSEKSEKQRKKSSRLVNREEEVVQTARPDVVEMVLSRKDRSKRNARLKGFIVNSDKSVRRIDDHNCNGNSSITNLKTPKKVGEQQKSRRSPPPSLLRVQNGNSNRSVVGNSKKLSKSKGKSKSEQKRKVKSNRNNSKRNQIPEKESSRSENEATPGTRMKFKFKKLKIFKKRKEAPSNRAIST